MADNKIYIFAGGRKVAEGCGKALATDSAMGCIDPLKVAADGTAHSVQELQATIDDINLRRLRQMAMGKKPRLPRKLKKAAKHADFDVFDLNNKIDAQQDGGNVNATIEYNQFVRTKPAGYPRTKWVRRLTNIVHRIMLSGHRRFIKRLLLQQCLNQHPGMLTYDDAPSNPAQHHKDLYAGSELVLDKNQQQRLANILNLKEK